MFKDSVIYFLSKLLPAVLSFGVLFIFLSAMHPNSYGQYSVIILSVGLLNIVSSQWIRSSMLRFYNNNPNNIMDNTITIQILVVAINIIVTMIILYFFELSFISKFIIIIFSVNFIFNELFNNYYRTILKPGVVLYGNIIKNSFFVIALLCVWFVNGKITLPLALLSSVTGQIISNTYYVINFQEKIRLRLDKNVLKSFSAYGLPLTISFALGVLLQNIDKYLITYKLGTLANGYYSLVYDIMHNSLYMIMGALGMASLPRLLKYSSDNLSLKKDFNKYIEYLYIVSLPILTIIFAVIPEVVTIFRDFNYKTSILIVSFIVLATFIHGINSFVYSQAVQLLKHTKIIFIPSLIAVVVSTILNLILLGKIGVLAAAITSIVAFLSSNLLLYYILKQKSDFNFLPKNIVYLLPVMIIITAISWNINIPNDYISIIVKSFVVLSILTVYIYLFRNTFFKKEIN